MSETRSADERYASQDDASKGAAEGMVGEQKRIANLGEVDSPALHQPTDLQTDVRLN